MKKDQSNLALVTGASSGLGQQIALKLAEQGYHVVLSARDKSRLEETAREIRDRNGVCTVIPVDLSDRNSVDRLISTLNDIGFVSVIVNNAGYGQFEAFADSGTEAWDRQIAVNLTGAYLITRGFIKSMMDRKSGTIVFINSTAGLQGYSHSVAYTASKHGLLGLARSLREEMRDYNVKVISVHPGAFDSGFWDKAETDFDRGSMMENSHVADTVVHAICQKGNTVLEEIILRRTAGDF